MSDEVRQHYEAYPYPGYPLLASVRRCDTYALNLAALWTRFNGALPPQNARKILIAGCGSFAPYPFAVSNPDIPITALDLSSSNLKRARLHCLLHGISNVSFLKDNLRDHKIANGPYGLIDSYGVIHHLPDPLQGMRALASRLVDGGIVRIMVYSRYARKAEESIRRAFKVLGISDAVSIRKLLKRARPGSRLHNFVESSYEAQSDSGLADALLHPCVTTYTIDGFLELIRHSGLQLLMFAHSNALDDVEAEIRRIRNMESSKDSPGNFVAFLGLNTKGSSLSKKDSLLQINPCLANAIKSFSFSDLNIPPRIGHENPPLTRSRRRELRRFIKPVRADELSDKDYIATDVYRKALFLLQYTENNN